MSFFFKSSKNKQQPPPSALPQATRNLKSSEGPGSAPSNTTVPALNGVSARDGSRPKSPPNGVSANGSINSTLMEKPPNRNVEDGDASYEKIAVSPSPEQKSMRDRSDSDHRGPPVRILSMSHSVRILTSCGLVSRCPCLMADSRNQNTVLTFVEAEPHANSSTQQTRSRSFTISMVSTPTHIYFSTRQPLPTLWRRSQLRCVKRRFHLHYGRLDQWLGRQR